MAGASCYSCCYSCRLLQVAEEAALGKVAGLQAQIDNLARDVASCQVTTSLCLRSDPQPTTSKSEVQGCLDAFFLADPKIGWKQVQMREGLAALEAQKVVNSELMQRKQDVEWQLLNALSQASRHCFHAVSLAFMQVLGDW